MLLKIASILASVLALANAYFNNKAKKSEEVKEVEKKVEKQQDINFQSKVEDTLKAAESKDKAVKEKALEEIRKHLSQ